MTATTTHRVTCPDFTHEVTGLDAAHAFVISVETSGACRQLHTVEVRDGDGWLALHLARARDILATPLRATLDTPDGPMVKSGGGWSRETGERVGLIASFNGDAQAWIAAMGPHEHTMLTADGHGVATGRWCRCQPAPDAATWVRFELWTAQGRAAHGYACPACRGITQTG